MCNNSDSTPTDGTNLHMNLYLAPRKKAISETLKTFLVISARLKLNSSL